MAGRGGVPVDADAVFLNLTAVSPDGAGYLTAYPCGATRPLTSNVNYGPGDVIPNAVLAKIGAGGKVCIFTLAASDIIADVNGYVPPGGSPNTAVPARVLETRVGPTLKTIDGEFEGIGKRPAGATVELDGGGAWRRSGRCRCGVPESDGGRTGWVRLLDGLSVWVGAAVDLQRQLRPGRRVPECGAGQDRHGWQGVHLHQGGLRHHRRRQRLRAERRNARDRAPCRASWRRARALAW